MDEINTNALVFAFSIELMHQLPERRKGTPCELDTMYLRINTWDETSRIAQFTASTAVPGIFFLIEVETTGKKSDQFIELKDLQDFLMKVLGLCKQNNEAILQAVHTFIQGKALRSHCKGLNARLNNEQDTPCNDVALHGESTLASLTDLGEIGIRIPIWQLGEEIDEDDRYTFTYLNPDALLFAEGRTVEGLIEIFEASLAS
jgi:hypothetical protein